MKHAIPHDTVIYFLETLNYHKRREHVDRTVNSLDFLILRNQADAKIEDLAKLMDLIQDFFAP